MTTTVKVTACCTSDKEVIFDILDIKTEKVIEHNVLQDGDVLEKYVYDGRTAIVFEQVKGDVN